MDFVIAVDGMLRRLDQCETEEQREEWLLKYDKLIAEGQEYEE